MPEGSWKCVKCKNINYPFRTKCNRPSCGEEKSQQTDSPDDLVTDQEISCPFFERWRLIENEIIRPRHCERKQAIRYKNMIWNYFRPGERIFGYSPRQKGY